MGQFQAGQLMLENTFRAEFFVPSGSEFPDFCQGREVTSIQPTWQAHPRRGCHDVKTRGRGGWVASGKIPL